MKNTNANNTIKSIHFAYPISNGFKYAGMAHDEQTAINDFTRWALSYLIADIEQGIVESSYNVIAIADTIAAHTSVDTFTAYARVSETFERMSEQREQMKDSGLMDALMHHTNVTDYPTC